MTRTDLAIASSRALPVYPTFEAAERRVMVLIQLGMWPGIVTCPTGYSLTFDPQFGDKPWKMTNS